MTYDEAKAKYESAKQWTAKCQAAADVLADTLDRAYDAEMEAYNEMADAADAEEEP